MLWNIAATQVVRNGKREGVVLRLIMPIGRSFHDVVCCPWGEAYRVMP